MLVAAQTSSYSLNSNATFQNFFQPPSRTLYDTNTFITAASTWVTNYWNLSSLSLSRFGHLRDHTGSIRPPRLTLVRWNGTFWNDTEHMYDMPMTTNTITHVYDLTLDDPLGPFTIDNTSSIDLPLLQSTSTATFHVEFQSLNIGPLGAVPYFWELDAVFTFVPGAGSCNFELLTHKSLFNGVDGTIDFSLQIVLCVFLFLWCLFSIWLSARALYRGFVYYRVVKKAFSELPPGTIGKYTTFYSDWNSLPFSMKRRFVSFWNLWNLVGNILLILAAILAFVRYAPVVRISQLDMMFNLLLGLGNFMVCVNLTRYFEMSRRFAVLVNTLRLSFSRVIGFTISVLPTFIGFLMLGVAMFSNFSSRFSSMDQVAVALFCIANGDEIHATFDDLRLSFPWLWFSRLYLYVFLFLFITAVMNIFIFMIDDAFQAAKTWDKKAWKEKQSFSLPNLIAILELEGKGLLLSKEGFQLMDPVSGVATQTSTTSLVESTTDDDLEGGMSTQDEGTPLILAPSTTSTENEDDDASASGQPAFLKRSVTMAINIERKKRSRSRARKGKEAVGSPAKDKDEEETKLDVDAIVDSAMEQMMKHMKEKFEEIREQLHDSVRTHMTKK